MASLECRRITLKRLEANFRRTYSEQQTALIDSIVRDYSDVLLAKIGDSFIRSHRSLPMPDQFYDMARKLGWREKVAPSNSRSHTFNCDVCSGTGYALHESTEQEGRLIFAQCNCPLGANPLNGPLGHRLHDKSRALKFPVGDFKDERAVAGGVNMRNLYKKIQWWRGCLEQSRIYWQTQKEK